MIALTALAAGLHVLRALDDSAIGIALEDQVERIRFESELPTSVREFAVSPGAEAFLRQCALLAAESWPGLWRIARPVNRTRLAALSALKLVMTSGDWEAYDEHAGILEYEAGHDREYAEVMALAEMAVRNDDEGVRRLVEFRERESQARRRLGRCTSEERSAPAAVGRAELADPVPF